MPASSLEDFEKTIAQLVLDLLRAPVEHRELVLSPPVDARGDFSPTAVRISQHWAAAMLAYGFEPQEEELQRAAEWFGVPFPNDFHRRIDPVEMNRLEALLSLNPQHPTVYPRLDQLSRQRMPVGDFFDIQTNDPAFGTLLAVKVMALARSAGVLNGLMPEDTLRDFAGRMVEIERPDKDLALAVKLRHDLKGKLTPSQQRKYLSKLDDMAAQCGGFWGLPNDMAALAEQVQRGASFELIAEYRDVFREMIVNTCYVIENIMPLADDYPQVRPLMQRAMEQWWGVFAGKNAVEKLHTLFPDPYDYLLILCRTIIAARAYAGYDLIQRVGPHIHREYAEQQARPPETVDVENIRRALREWIVVDLKSAPLSLRKGQSDSDVMRIEPFIANPRRQDGELLTTILPNAETLIVKFGPIEDIQLERENYTRIPGSIREHFVDIPAPDYVDKDSRRAYVIMADLHRFRPLEDALRDLPQFQNQIVAELGPFLRMIHSGDGRERRSGAEALLWELYLAPMQQHMRRVFQYTLENRLLDGDTKQKRQALGLQKELTRQIGKLVQHQLELDDFPLAVMHGDLHSRNIMVRRVRHAGEYEVIFKLIDLEKFLRGGDAALDAGELLVDLDILRVRNNEDPMRDPIIPLMQQLEEHYTAFARERDDATFMLRMRLGQARSLIRIAKARTKVGEAALKESRKSPAVKQAQAAMNDVGRALGYLQEVNAALT